MAVRRRRRAEELVAERVRRYHETRIPRSHRYVGVPRAVSTCPSSRPNSPGDGLKARSRRTRTSPDPDEEAREKAKGHWATVSGVKNAAGMMDHLLFMKKEEPAEEEEEEDDQNVAFDTTQLLAELKKTEDSPTSPIDAGVSPEPEEDDLDLLVMTTDQPIK